jgi:hypothetical protein
VAELKEELAAAKMQVGELQNAKALVAKDLDEWKRIHKDHLHGPLNGAAGFVKKANDGATLASVTGNAQLAASIKALVAEVENWNRDLLAAEKRIHEIDFLEVVGEKPPQKPGAPTNLQIVNPPQ